MTSSSYVHCSACHTTSWELTITLWGQGQAALNRLCSHHVLSCDGCVLHSVQLTTQSIPTGRTGHTRPPRRRHWRSWGVPAVTCSRRSQSDSPSPSHPDADLRLWSGPQSAACWYDRRVQTVDTEEYGILIHVLYICKSIYIYILLPG